METNFSEPIAELGDLSWEELEVIEHPESGHLMFKDKIRRRDPKGEVTEQEVYVRIIRDIEIVKARGETRLLFKRIEGLDEDRDKDTFEQLETIVGIARAIRSPKKPFEQFCTAEELATRWDVGSLLDLNARIDLFRRMTDPRPTATTVGEAMNVIHQVARRSSMLPLTGIAGRGQPSLLLFMARLAMQSPTARSWLQSHGISTQEPSPKKD